MVEVEWEGTFKNWSRKWISANFWRVRYLFLDRDDALQECALIFVRVCKYYADKVDNERWLMGLYKTSVHNNWIVFALRDFKMRRALAAAAELDLLASSNYDVNLGPSVLRLLEFDHDIQYALSLISDASPEQMKVIFGSGKDASINKHLRMLCGTDTDFAAAFRTLPTYRARTRRIRCNGPRKRPVTATHNKGSQLWLP